MIRSGPYHRRPSEGLTAAGGSGLPQELQPRDPLKVGPYRLLGVLGGGGMGRVFLGRSPGGRLVAVKLVRAELAEQAEFRNRFAREVAAARRVSGLFTAPVVDADLDAPVPWLATAYVSGLSLADAVTTHGPLPVTTVLALAAGLAEGLGAIHAAGIVHRDLKPSNVLLAEDGPRVIDFGISQAAEATMLTGTGVVVGSPAFMSPEQARGHRVGPPSDVFSLGAVLTFAATGRGPFGGGASATLMYRVVFNPPDTSDLPAELRPLVEWCLAKDPEQRPTTDQLLAELNTASPAAGWLPAPIIQAFPSEPGPSEPGPSEPGPSEPGPAAPTAVDDLSVTPVMTELAAAARAGEPGGRRGGRRPGRSRLGLASTAAAVVLAIAYLIVAVTARLPPFGTTSFPPSSPAPATTAPASTGPRPSPSASPLTTSPANSPPVTSPATSPPATFPATVPPATSPPATSPVTTPPATSPATSPPPTSPVTTPPPTSPATSPSATSPPATSPPSTSPATPPPAISPATSPPAISPATSPPPAQPSAR